MFASKIPMHFHQGLFSFCSCSHDPYPMSGPFREEIRGEDTRGLYRLSDEAGACFSCQGCLSSNSKASTGFVG